MLWPGTKGLFTGYFKRKSYPTPDVLCRWDGKKELRKAWGRGFGCHAVRTRENLVTYDLRRGTCLPAIQQIFSLFFWVENSLVPVGEAPFNTHIVVPVSKPVLEGIRPGTKRYFSSCEMFVFILLTNLSLEMKLCGVVLSLPYKGPIPTKCSNIWTRARLPFQMMFQSMKSCKRGIIMPNILLAKFLVMLADFTGRVKIIVRPRIARDKLDIYFETSWLIVKLGSQVHVTFSHIPNRNKFHVLSKNFSKTSDATYWYFNT